MHIHAKNGLVLWQDQIASAGSISALLLAHQGMLTVIWPFLWMSEVGVFDVITTALHENTFSCTERSMVMWIQGKGDNNTEVWLLLYKYYDFIEQWFALEKGFATWKCSLTEAEWGIFGSVQHTNIGSDNGLAPVPCQAIIYSNVVTLSITP